MSARRESCLAGRRISAIVLGALMLWTCVAVSAELPKVGDVPPNVFGKDQRRERVDLEALKGEVVVLTFWASWCGPCMKEMQMLSQLKALADKQNASLEIIAVNFHESHERYRQIQKLLKDLPIRVVEDRYARASQTYGIKGIPNMWLIGRDGVIAGHHVGYSEAQLNDLLAEISALMSAPAQVAMLANPR
ncbi:MAG: TlpA disulfide reductase family protein [Pseudomonadota bacterium]|nr:TlpA disulfide reductase family protein [Pseudomonadota bacterium]